MQPTSWAGSCGLRPLPSWKPQGGEGRGGEKRRREERSRHGALESSQGCQMPDAGHLLLYLGNRQLLGLSVATMVTLTYFGAHFAVIRRASLEKNPYQAVHQWAFSAGLSLVGLLTLGAVLSAAGTVREAQGLMAGGFLCFSLAFCAQVQLVFWRLHNPTQVEDAMLDTYDLVYEQAMKGTSHVGRQELAAIQDTVSALLLSSFLWFAIRSGCSLDRKGQYTLAPRACGRQPQEPSVFRRSQGGPAHCLRSEADAIGPRRYSGSLRWLQDNDAAPGPLSHHLPAHRGEDIPAFSPHGIPEGRVRAVRRGVSEGPAREPASIGNRRKGRGSSPNPSMGTGRVQAQRKPRWRQQPRADLQTPAVHALEGSTQTQAATVFYAV
ncbi:tetraspanin-32 isoform X5 [Papio anubis]|uniref:tetraspanin-32 isoform X5 n=1 Tax=Papio anubis TaxID=9555 RepID=UPI000B7B99F5|nr:tetraspanin-32 isoform X5 [Papio anubis]